MSQEWKSADMPELTNKTAIVTGANSGLGYHTVVGLAAKGARVIMACRSQERGETALNALRQEVPDADVQLLLLDLGSLASVHSFASAVAEHIHALDLLINNAGIMMVPKDKTEDGFEQQFGINHLGHYALTAALLPLLVRSASARVVNVSSLYHRSGEINFDDLMGEQSYSKTKAYAQSKLANVLFTRELDKRCKRAGLPVVAVSSHPGYAATNLQFVGPQRSGSWLGKQFMRLLNATVAQSAKQGALPTLYAATSDTLQGNELIGPNGFQELRGTPERVDVAEQGCSDEDAQRLWEVSARLTEASWSLLEVQQHTKAA